MLAARAGSGAFAGLSATLAAVDKESITVNVCVTGVVKAGTAIINVQASL